MPTGISHQRLIGIHEGPCLAVMLKLAVPPTGLGQRLDRTHAWLDENCAADGWAMTPAGIRGVVNDAIAIYFLDATLASAFVARWCVGSRAAVADGVFQVREDEPTIRVSAKAHKTP